MGLGGIEMEFTEEQLVEIEKRVADETKHLYTEEELNKEVLAEVDRRVESGIKKGLATQKSKWEEEYESKTKMSAEELAKLSVKEQLDEIAKKEAEINTRSNRIDARELFSKADIPEDDYIKFMDLLVTDDGDATHTNVSNFIDTFSTTRDNIEKTVKEKLSNIPAPKGGADEVKPKTGVQDFITMANEANIRKQ